MQPSRERWVLVVDNDAAELRLAVGALEEAGYRVLSARGPSEAIIAGELAPGGVDLVVAAIELPVMDGLTLVQCFERFNRHTPRSLLTTALPAWLVADTLSKWGAILRKPYTLAALRDAVAQALARPRIAE